jgi:hypothetical protein
MSSIKKELSKNLEILAPYLVAGKALPSIKA